MIAKFDASAGQAYVSVALPPAAGYTLTFQAFMTPEALVAFQTDPNCSLLAIPAAGNIDGIYIESGAPDFSTYFGSPGGTVDLGSWMEIECVLTFSSGTSRDTTFTANGAIFADGVQDYALASTDPFPINVGPIFCTSASPGAVVYVRNFVAKDNTNAVVFADDFSGGDLSAWDTTVGAASVVADSDVTPAVEGSGGVRVSVAFDDTTLEENPVWTDVTAVSPSLVASYEIDKSRDFELDRQGNSSATIRLSDRDGVLDPTNSTGPYYTKLEPDIQIQIELWNPVAAEWQSRFRGYIEDFSYDLEASQRVNYLTVTCYDIIALHTSIEMQPGQFGDTPPAGSEATVFFDNNTFQGRIDQVEGNAGIPSTRYVAFTGNVNLLEATYSPGTNPMDVIQETADAEFPGVSNVYPDRFGRLVAHGRLAEFDPAGTAADAGPAAWDFHHWKCGDSAAVAASPSDTAHIRPPFSWNRGRSKVINSAYCYPADCPQADLPGQVVTDPTSIGLRGIKSWSKEKLLVLSGILTGNTGKQECLAFANYVITNYAEPRNRITALTFRTMDARDPRAAATWNLLCKSDIADLIDVTVTDPGGGGFNLEPFRIEGVKEIAEPLNGEYANVTLSLDVAPVPLLVTTGLDGT